MEVEVEQWNCQIMAYKMAAHAQYSLKTNRPTRISHIIMERFQMTKFSLAMKILIKLETDLNNQLWNKKFHKLKIKKKINLILFNNVVSLGTYTLFKHPFFLNLYCFKFSTPFNHQRSPFTSKI